MFNPIKAYANLNQRNRRFVTFGAGAAAALTGGTALAIPVAYAAAIADGYHFHKEKKVGARIRAGFLTMVVAVAGSAMIPNTFEPTKTVAEAPVVAEAPAAPAELPICSTSTTPTYSMAPSAPCRPAPKPVTRNYEYATVEAAKGEMCAAGRQYLGDVLAGRMGVEAGKNEVRQYSTYLSRNSPAGKSQLLNVGMACSRLWSF